MGLKVVEAFSAQRGQRVVEHRNLLPGVIVGFRIVGGRKVGADSGKVQRAHLPDAFRQVNGILWIHTHAMHPGIYFQVHVKRIARSR